MDLMKLIHNVTDLSGGNHKIFYTDGSGNVIELAHGLLGSHLVSNGTTSAPSWDAIAAPLIPTLSAVLDSGNTTSGRDMLFTTTDELRFRDTAVFLNSATDGHLDYTTDISHDFIIGATEQIVLKDGVLEPTTQDDIDLGSADKKFKEVFVFHATSQPVRVLGTVYRNTTGHPIMVYGSIKCLWSDDHVTPNNVAYFKCFTDSSTPPTTEVGRGGTLLSSSLVVANTLAEQYFGFFFVVADDDYYKIDAVTVGFTTVVIHKWNEANF